MQVGGLFVPTLLVGFENNRTQNPSMKIKTSSSDVIGALVEYSQLGDSVFDTALRVYHAWSQGVGVQDRLDLCQAFGGAVQSNEGDRYEGLLLFVAADPNFDVVCSAARKLAFLYPAQERDQLDGPRLVARIAQVPTQHIRRAGAILGGLISLGDERITPLIRDVWAQLPASARAEAVSRRSSLVSRAHVLLLVDLLEEETDEAVYDAIIGKLGNLAIKAQKNGVLDLEYVFPAWRSCDDPLLVREYLSREEFAPEIIDRLARLAETEPGNEKVLPFVCLLWRGFGQ
jgi:hypothetical protein